MTSYYQQIMSLRDAMVRAAIKPGHSGAVLFNRDLARDVIALLSEVGGYLAEIEPVPGNRGRAAPALPTNVADGLGNNVVKIGEFQQLLLVHTPVKGSA